MRPDEATLAILPNWPVAGLSLLDPHRVEEARRFMSEEFCLEGGALPPAAEAAAVAPEAAEAAVEAARLAMLAADAAGEGAAPNWAVDLLIIIR